MATTNVAAARPPFAYLDDEPAPVQEAYRRIFRRDSPHALREAQDMVRDLLSDVSRGQKPRVLEALQDLKLAIGEAHKRRRAAAAAQPR